MKPAKNLLFFSLIFIILTACNNSWDEYYARPDWLEGPIYQQLQKEGKFSMFISCLEATGYSDILGRTGYFTVFAPNDEAMLNFLHARGLSSIDQLDTISIRQIVQYAIIDNGYTIRQLAAYQSSKGWVYDASFRRQTRTNFSFVKDTAYDKDLGLRVPAYILYFGTKYTTYFIDDFMAANNITASDYSLFFPDAEYTGFNILGAKVIDKEIVAENGYIYELDKVNFPLPNIDEYLVVHPQKENYTLFKSILDRLAVYDFDSIYYQSLPIYFKSYRNLLYSPSNESWFTSGGEPNASQTNCWTFFAPDNQAVNNFLTEKLLVNYNSIDQIMNERSQIIYDFVNAHMFTTAIWPGMFAEKAASFGMTLTKSAVNNFDIASNGFFYGINTILQSGNIFNSVFGEVYLNPNYSMFYNAIDKVDPSLKNILTSKELQHTLILVTDSVFDAAGYGFNGLIFYEKSSPDLDIKEKFKRILHHHIIRGNITDISGSSYVELFNGEFLKYDGNKVWGGGNLEKNIPVSVLQSIPGANNGSLYRADGVVLPPTQNYMAILASPPMGASFGLFYQYLNSSGLVQSGKITEVPDGELLTILVPDDNAIFLAGLPPSSSTVPADKEKILRFLQYHIIPEKNILTSANFLGQTKTLLFTGMEGRVRLYESVTVEGEKGSITIRDKMGTIAYVINSAGSNIMTNDRAIILQINQVLKTE